MSKSALDLPRASAISPPLCQLPHPKSITLAWRGDSRHAMSRPNLANESLISSAIQTSAAMEIEETSFKRKTSTETHSPRPGPPRFSDLFDQPCSGAPVIIQFVSEPNSFTQLGISEKILFMSALTGAVGQVKAGTKWSHKGDLHIYPSSAGQKRKLLELKIVREWHIQCTLTMSEASVRGIIRNVPLKDSEEDLLSLLVDQGVTKVQRFSYIASDGSRQPMKTVTLSFSTPYLPHEVIMAHEIFPVRQFIPRPALCRKCWIFGHPEETCKATPSCKQCSQHHPLTNGCQNPLKCPTCSKPGHAAGTSDCPRYSHRQQVIKFAYENKIPIAEAGKILSNQNFPNPPQLPKIYPPTNNNDDIDDLRQQISQLKTQIEIITLHQPTTTARIDALEATVDDIQEKIAPLTNLPQALDKIKVDMTSGFDSNNAQLAAIASLLQGIRPPVKPPNKTASNYSDERNRK